MPDFQFVERIVKFYRRRIDTGGFCSIFVPADGKCVPAAVSAPLRRAESAVLSPRKISAASAVRLAKKATKYLSLRFNKRPGAYTYIGLIFTFAFSLFPLSAPFRLSENTKSQGKN